MTHIPRGKDPNMSERSRRARSTPWDWMRCPIERKLWLDSSAIFLP